MIKLFKDSYEEFANGLYAYNIGAIDLDWPKLCVMFCFIGDKDTKLGLNYITFHDIREDGKIGSAFVAYKLEDLPKLNKLTEAILNHPTYPNWDKTLYDSLEPLDKILNWIDN